jgi:pantetheine-phosphate adenylyltransferase
MPSNKPRAIYPGTFGPPTLAHQNIWEQAKRAFDVFVVVGENAVKNGAEPGPRAELVRAMGVEKDHVHIPFSGDSVVETARELKARFVIRGIRGPSDFEPEAAYADFIRRATKGSMQVVYFMSPTGYQHISSTLVRSIMALRGWSKDGLLYPYVPPPVIRALEMGAKLA